MKWLVVGILVAVSMVLCSGAWAAPSLLGPTGLVTVPTAEVLGLLQWNVGATAARADDGPDESVVFANVGLISGLEIGASTDDVEDAESETVLNAKLRVLGPLPGRITVAAGMMDVTDQIDRSSYAVLSHTLGGGVLTTGGSVALPQVHIGVGTGRLDGVFGGISTTVGRQLSLMAEYDGEDVNVGARWRFAPSLEAAVAALDGTEAFAVGLSLSSPW